MVGSELPERKDAMNIIRQRRRPLGRFNDSFGDLFERFMGLGDFNQDTDWIPAVDITRSEDDVVIKVDLPGMKAEDVDLSFEGDVLTISGTKQSEEQKEGADYYHSERRFGSFCRRISMPSDVDADKVKAECKDGVLTVTLPQTKKPAAKKIEVKG